MNLFNGKIKQKCVRLLFDHIILKLWSVLWLLHLI